MTVSEGTTARPDGASIIGRLAFRETLDGIDHYDVEGIALAFLTTLHDRFIAHAEMAMADSTDPDNDWRLAFLDDANELLVALGRLDNRLGRLEAKMRSLTIEVRS